MWTQKSTSFEDNKYMYIKKVYRPRTGEFIGYLIANKDGEKTVSVEEFTKMKKAKEIVFL